MFSKVSYFTTGQQYHYQCNSKRARNLWFLAYTILRNPQLQEMRVRSAPEEDQQRDEATSGRDQATPSNHHTSLSMPMNSADVGPQQSEIELGMAAPSVSRERDTSEVPPTTWTQFQSNAIVVSCVLYNAIVTTNLSIYKCTSTESHPHLVDTINWTVRACC